LEVANRIHDTFDKERKTPVSGRMIFEAKHLMAGGKSQQSESGNERGMRFAGETLGQMRAS
jgi:hypothetical protein